MSDRGTFGRWGKRGARRLLSLGFVVASTAVASVAAGENGRPQAEASREFTLGVVQRQLKRGLSQADVAERLGSPSLVMRDAEGREAWVYDKVSSEIEASSGSLGIAGGGSGGGTSVAALLGIAAGKRSERIRSSQKTLTVVVRFSATGAVSSYAWHSSRF